MHLAQKWPAFICVFGRLLDLLYGFGNGLCATGRVSAYGPTFSTKSRYIFRVICHEVNTVLKYVIFVSGDSSLIMQLLQ